jgi:hypothetical protein
MVFPKTNSKSNKQTKRMLHSKEIKHNHRFSKITKEMSFRRVFWVAKFSSTKNLKRTRRLLSTISITI